MDDSTLEKPYSQRNALVYRHWSGKQKATEKDDVLINLLNGTLEVSKTGYKLREHRREDFLTYQLQFAFKETAHNHFSTIT